VASIYPGKAGHARDNPPARPGRLLYVNRIKEIADQLVRVWVTRSDAANPPLVELGDLRFTANFLNGEATVFARCDRRVTVSPERYNNYCHLVDGFAPHRSTLW
jgi:hypothetical protein